MQTIDQMIQSNVVVSIDKRTDFLIPFAPDIGIVTALLFFIVNLTCAGILTSYMMSIIRKTGSKRFENA